MTEASSRREQLQSVIVALSSMMEKDAHDVPDWVAQELTLSQMRLLFLLANHGPAPMSRVAEWLGVALPTASGAVDRVERHGLVSREHRLDDRRVVECGLTDEGRRLIDEMSGMRIRMMNKVLGVLTDDELADMARLTGIMAERLKPRSP
jgi:DNA-binding MarR family transcriptional regulator